MSLKIEGFDDLQNQLAALGKVGEKIGRKAVKKGSEQMLGFLKAEAPKDTGSSAANLRVTGVKTYPSGNAYGECGIDGKNFDSTKGLWYNNYGFINARNGKRCTVHVGWMNRVFRRHREACQQTVADETLREIDRVLGQ